MTCKEWKAWWAKARPNYAKPADGNGTPSQAPAGGDDHEAKAAALLNVAEQFAKNKMPAKAIEKLNELIKKYPTTDTAKTAQERLKELQATGGPDK